MTITNLNKFLMYSTLLLFKCFIIIITMVLLLGMLLNLLPSQITNNGMWYIVNDDSSFNYLYRLECFNVAIVSIVFCLLVSTTDPEFMKRFLRSMPGYQIIVTALAPVQLFNYGTKIYCNLRRSKSDSFLTIICFNKL